MKKGKRKVRREKENKCKIVRVEGINNYKREKKIEKL